MTILFFGDVFGRPGRETLKKIAPNWAKKYKSDFVIVNIENLSHGNGITLKALEELNSLDLFTCYTSGDHIFDKPGAQKIIGDSAIPILVPSNMTAPSDKFGYSVIQAGIKKLLVINLIGRVFMKYGEKYFNPLTAADAILEKFTLDPEENSKEYVNGIFVDFHAEATSEKKVLASYLDGRVSAVAGTHTHVPTRDEQILPNGTAFITDVGMVGPYNSSLGLELKPLIQEYLTGKKQRRIAKNTLSEIGAVLIELNKNGTAKNIKHLRRVV
jgi:metallophosphoesterase (TIGR00282 family)